MNEWIIITCLLYVPDDDDDIIIIRDIKQALPGLMRRTKNNLRSSYLFSAFVWYVTLRPCLGGTSSFMTNMRCTHVLRAIFWTLNPVFSINGLVSAFFNLFWGNSFQYYGRWFFFTYFAQIIILRQQTYKNIYNHSSTSTSTDSQLKHRILIKHSSWSFLWHRSFFSFWLWYSPMQIFVWW